mgnify:CR=1 FL=1
MNLAQQLLIKTVKKYQKYISPDHSFWAKDNVPYCKHIPSCSEYMIESVEKKWAFIWWIKGIFRIFRCMPWNKWWYDPVDKNKK